MNKALNGFSLILLFCFVIPFANAADSKPDSVKARGYCGDGVINGNEDCDGNDLKIRSCKVLNGGEGELKCQSNCVYDISSCNNATTLANLINARVGGIVETCKCKFSRKNCDGGCAPRGYNVGASRCQYRCEQDVDCNCGDLLKTYVDRCDFECDCQTTPDGTPQCVCSQNQCDLVVATNTHIGTILEQRSLAEDNLTRPLPVSTLQPLPQLSPVPLEFLEPYSAR